MNNWGGVKYSTSTAANAAKTHDILAVGTAAHAEEWSRKNSEKSGDVNKLLCSAPGILSLIVIGGFIWGMVEVTKDDTNDKITGGIILGMVGLVAWATLALAIYVCVKQCDKEDKGPSVPLMAEDAPYNTRRSHRKKNRHQNRPSHSRSTRQEEELYKGEEDISFPCLEV